MLNRFVAAIGSLAMLGNQACSAGPPRGGTTSTRPATSAPSAAVVVPSAEPSVGKPAVLAYRYALDELKVFGIISGPFPRALVADPTGMGWVIKVGDRVGRIGQAPQGPDAGDAPSSWRVDSIRQNDVVFVHDGEAAAPATRRVLAMEKRK